MSLAAFVATAANAQIFTGGKSGMPLAYLNLGVELEYCYLGTKIEVCPVRHLAVFGSIGYYLTGIGINGGVSLKLLPAKKLSPYLLGMWGLNGLLLTVGGKDLFFTPYFGFTTGAGLELYTGKKRNKVSFAVLYPLRNAEYKEKTSGSNFPLGFSLGFGFAFRGPRHGSH